MSIQTAILAKSPDLYWPLNDPTGPLSADISTPGGHPGFYGGPFATGELGPEAGTSSVRMLTPAGFVWSNPQPFGNVFPLSFSVWAAIDTFNPTPNAMLWWADFSTKGFALTLQGGQLTNNQLSINRYGVGTLATGSFVRDADWHHYVLVQGEGGGVNFKLYVDATLTFSSATGYNFVPAGTGTLGIGGQGGYFAHFARFPSALSATDVNNLFVARVSPIHAPSATGTAGSVDSTNVEAILALCNLIYAAVHRTFPTT